MTKLLEQVVEDLRTLSREEQDRAAKALLAFLDGSQDDFRLMAGSGGDLLVGAARGAMC